MSNKKIKIMCGLPGSGKTIFSKKLEKGPEKYEYWDFDSYSLEKNITGFLADFNGRFKQRKNHVIDGLFLTNKDYKRIVHSITALPQVQQSKFSIDFHYFIPDREGCLRNDEYRCRPVSASVTIMNAEVEEPNAEEIKQHLANVGMYVDVNVIKHKIVVQLHVDVEYEKFKNKHKYTFENDYLYSEPWRRGGNVCDYTGECYEVGPDDEPDQKWENFPELERLLNKIFPEAPQEVKDKIFSMVYIDYDRGDGDYYGGYVDRSAFAINIKNMYQYLYDNGLVTMAKLLGGNI